MRKCIALLVMAAVTAAAAPAAGQAGVAAADVKGGAATRPRSGIQDSFLRFRKSSLRKPYRFILS